MVARVGFVAFASGTIWAPARKARIISRASRRARCMWASVKPVVWVMGGQVPGRLVPAHALNLFRRSSNALDGLVTLLSGRPSSASKRPSAVSLVGATGFGIEALCGGHIATRKGLWPARSWSTVGPKTPFWEVV